MKEEREFSITVQGVPQEEFDLLWNMPDGGYPCDGCGMGLSAPGWCTGCYEREQAKLAAWNQAAKMEAGS